MTKSEIVEALRCAADLCNSRSLALQGGSLTIACRHLDVDFIQVESAAFNNGVNVVSMSRSHVTDKQHRLLEAAQRIEEGE